MARCRSARSRAIKVRPARSWWSAPCSVADSLRALQGRARHDMQTHSTRHHGNSRRRICRQEKGAHSKSAVSYPTRQLMSCTLRTSCWLRWNTCRHTACVEKSSISDVLERPPSPTPAPPSPPAAGGGLAADGVLAASEPVPAVIPPRAMGVPPSACTNRWTRIRHVSHIHVDLRM
jgi:hypothetical protein